METLKKKPVLIAIAVLLLVVFLGGGYYVLGAKKPGQKVNVQTANDEITVTTASPEEIGLKISARPDGRGIKFVINNPKDITFVEYTMSYKRKLSALEAKERAGEGDGSDEYEEGLYGEIKVDDDSEPIEIDYKDLGTCSSGKCRYHDVTSPITLVLKITKKDGSVLEVTDEFNLEQ